MLSKESLNQKETQSKTMFDYNKASNSQLSWILNNRINFELAVDNLPPHNSSLNIGDYGCSHGLNSVHIINYIFKNIQCKSNYIKELEEINVYHEDLPSNDFTEVQKCVEDPKIGYKNHPLITSNEIQLESFYIGKSYYEPIVKEGTLDMLICYNSIHWMPEYFPCKYGLGYMAEYNDPELTPKFNEMSAKFLENWLNLRYEELKQKGLILVNFIFDSNLVGLFNKYWLLALKKHNFTQSDLDKVVFPVYFREFSEVQRIITKLNNKFSVIYNETRPEPTKFSKLAIRALTKNQILAGLSKYPNIEESVKDDLYQSFEDSVFDEGREYLEPTGKINWTILKKL